MQRVIKGTIEYTLTVDDKSTEIVYESTIDNDLAALCMGKYIMENMTIGLRNQKKVLTGKEKQLISQLLDRTMRGHGSLDDMINYFIDSYNEFIEYKESEAEKDAKIKEWIKENVTLGENGELTEEQVKELIEKKKNEQKKDN